MEMRKVIKTTQEQAVASWVNYLNQVRLDRLMEALDREQENLNEALQTIGETLSTISRDIVNKGYGRGGERGVHGFIAEVAETGIGNAREQIEGRAPVYEWINDNGPADLRRGAEYIQQKFVNSGDHLSLQAIKQHFQAYPDFLDNGGKYQIPADHYEKIKWLLSIPEDEANKMPTSNGEFSLRQWREVREFFRTQDIPLDKVEPSALEYTQVQKNVYEETLETEKQRLQDRNKERRDQAYQESKPSLAEGAKATAVAAASEGLMAFCQAIAAKRKEGKHLKDLDQKDWEEIIGNTGTGTVKGGIRGVSLYLLTNYTASPAAVANAFTTSAFGVAEQAHRFREGEIDEQGFIENSEMLCLDAAVSALSSLAGQVLIPVPVVGAVIGNAVGMMMYQIAKDNLAAKEQRLLEQHLAALQVLENELQDEYRSFTEQLAKNMEQFMDILDRAFSPDIRVAFTGSVELAKEMGVPTEEILDTREKVFSYFLD